MAETLSGTSSNDTLVGGVDGDQLTGNGGDDSLAGAAGDDRFLYSGSAGGFDIVDGGADNDEIRALANSTVIGLKSLTGVEEIDGGGFVNVVVRGSSSADLLDFSGTTLVGISMVESGDGADTLIGSAGDDTMQGQGGDDSIAAGLGADEIRFHVSSNGFDAIDGGGGLDTISGTGANATIGLRSLVGVELITSNYTGVQILGSSGDDNLDFSATTIVGITLPIRLGAGNDSALGTFDADTIAGDAGNDTLDGGAGGFEDTVSYAGATSAVNVSLAITSQQDTGGAGLDVLTNFENILGSGHDDTLTGSSQVNGFFYSGATNGFDAVDGGGGYDEIRALAAGTVIGLRSLININAIDANGFANVLIRGSGGADLLDFSGTTLTGITMIEAGDGADTVLGSGGADTIWGQGGDDSIDASSGNDLIRFWTTSQGFDAVDGSFDNDTIEAIGDGVVIGLRYLANVELITTTYANVTISGSSGNDYLDFTGATITGISGPIRAGAGNDTVTGTSGADTIVGEAGDDELIGGDGIDTASYAGATTGVSVSLLTGLPQNTGGAGVDSLWQFENLLGSAHNDTLTGDSGADNKFLYTGVSNGFDVIDGVWGYDEIRALAAGTVIGLQSIANVDVIDGGGFANVIVRGSGGADLLDFSGTTLNGIGLIEAGEGADTLIGSNGADTMQGQGGDDSIAAGSGADEIRFHVTSNGFDAIDGGDGLDKITGTGPGAIIGLRYLANVELITTTYANVSISGSSGNDHLDFTGATITGLLPLIKAGAGHDSVQGTSGADTILGEGGDDTLSGGDGVDTLSFAGSAGPANLNLATGTQSGTVTGSDVVSGFEQVIGSAHDDTLVGGSANESFLYTGTANGFDSVDGGGGQDQIRALAAGTVIGLKTLSGVETIDSGGFAGVVVRGSGGADLLNFSTTTLTGINLIEAGEGADTLIGSSGADTMQGQGGDDSIAAGSGADEIRFHVSSNGFDAIDGGDGADTISGTGSGATIGLRYLANVELITTAYTNVVIAGSSGDDHLDFNGATITGVAPLIRAGAGNDSIRGTSGADTIMGEAGNDTLSGGDGVDTLSFAGSTGPANLNLATGTQSGTVTGSDVVSGFEQVIGSAHDDTLVGSSGDEGFLNTGVANGFDAVDGGDGQDEIRATAAGTVIGLKMLSGVEAINSGGFASVIVRGSAGADQLDFSGATLTGIAMIETGEGADTLIGSAGGDTMQGQGGDDSIAAGSGADEIRFHVNSNGFDAVDGGDGADTITGTGPGAIIGLRYLANVELITTAYTNVSITGSSGNDYLDFTGATITGIAGPIKAGAGNDTVTGTSGADTIVGEAGDDEIAGGGGIDTASYAGATAGVSVDLQTPLAQNTGGAGVDSLWEIENLLGSAHNDTLSGGVATDNTFFYTGVSNGFDSVDGGGGQDQIRAQAAGTVIGLQSMANIDVIHGGGFANVIVRGSAGADQLDFSATTLTGITMIEAGDGTDTLIGSAGGDTMQGQGGDDSIAAGSGADEIRFHVSSNGFDVIDGGDGADTISGTGPGAIIGLSSFSNIEAISSAYANVSIAGTSGGDDFNFSGVAISGIVAIKGGTGDDTIVGSSGADTIQGDAGSDQLSGGGGADLFDFNALSESASVSAHDTIVGFTSGSDRIDVTALDANANAQGNQVFSFIGTAAFTAAGQLRYDTSIAGKTIVQGDVNGDGVSDFYVELTGTLTLVSTDFVL